MQKTRIAAVQFNSLLGRKEHNLRIMQGFIEKASKKGAHLVLFPELCLQGHWVSTDVYPQAEILPGGKSVKKIERLCRKHRLHVSFGMAALMDNVVYNAHVLVGPKGYLGTSCKLHMSGDEYLTYRGGDAIPVFDIGVCRLGHVVCYDNVFPEVARALAVNGAEVILMPHAGRSGQWKTLDEEKQRVRQAKTGFQRDYAMRARENATFCVVTNQVGRAGHVKLYPKNHDWQPHHAGGILFFDPHGSVIAQSKTQRARQEMVLADLDPAVLAQARGTPNFTLRNRRPELYTALTRPLDAP